MILQVVNIIYFSDENKNRCKRGRGDCRHSFCFVYSIDVLLIKKQKVKINGITGEKMLITCVVPPQESVLSPTLFLLYINSICDLDINRTVCR